MELSVYNIKGEATSKKVTLNAEIFGIEPNDHAIYLDVKQHNANARQGTAKSKERAEVARTTKKLKKQKGTGGARSGSMKSPLHKGGGTVFGPKPRDYHFKVNKKTKTLARLSALSYKAKQNGITIIEDFKIETPKTSEFIAVVNNLKVSDKKSLVIVAEYDKSLYLSSRNFDRSKVVTVADLNTYDILNAKTLVFLEGSISKLEEFYKN
ncbi:MAG: 50S ribosomal protein L4 [Bacteroidota bacterium]